MVSTPSPSSLKRVRTFFSKKYFSYVCEGKFVGGIVLHGGTNDQVIPKVAEFHKMYFPAI